MTLTIKIHFSGTKYDTLAESELTVTGAAFTPIGVQQLTGICADHASELLAAKLAEREKEVALELEVAT